MKHLYLFIVTLLLASQTHGQSAYKNASYFLGDEPMAGFKNLQASDELVFHWTKHHTPDIGRLYYDFLDHPHDSLHPLKSDEITPPVSQLGNTAGVAGDLDGDMVDELVTLIGINSNGNYLLRSEFLRSVEFIGKYPNVSSSTGTNPDATSMLLSGNVDTTFSDEIILIHDLEKYTANEVFLSVEILGLNAAGNGLEEKKTFQLPLLDVEKKCPACLSDLDSVGQFEIFIVVEQAVKGASESILHITTAQIAAKLYVSHETVKSHRQNLSHKLKARIQQAWCAEPLNMASFPRIEVGENLSGDLVCQAV